MAIGAAASLLSARECRGPQASGGRSGAAPGRRTSGRRSSATAGCRHPAVAVVAAQRLLDASPSVVQVVPHLLLSRVGRAFGCQSRLGAPGVPGRSGDPAVSGRSGSGLAAVSATRRVPPALNERARRAVPRTRASRSTIEGRYCITASLHHCAPCCRAAVPGTAPTPTPSCCVGSPVVLRGQPRHPYRPSPGRPALPSSACRTASGAAALSLADASPAA